MGNPEAFIIVLNLTIVLIAYFVIYPRLAGSDGNKVVRHDLFASLVSLFIAGSFFWESGQEFNAVFTTLNWFWFSLLTYVTIEIPFVIWYFNKHKIWEQWN